MNNISKFDSYRKVLTWFAALALSALVAACGGDGGSGDPVVVPSGPAPTVTDLSAGANATGVPVNTKLITVAFTSAMDPATLTAASFTLACPVGTPITGTVAYLATDNLATFRIPAATNLPANTVCTATITTAVKNTSGVAIASNFTWTFTTGAATVPDIAAPTVSGTVNLNGATNVPVNTKPAIVFSERMDPATINATTFTVTQGATAVAGTVSYTGVTAVFTPAANLTASTNYTVTATTGIKDLAGNALANNFAITWTTAGADTTGPTVTDTINALGTITVGVNTNAGVTFSEPMDPLTITNATFTLVHTLSGTPVAGTVSFVGVNAVFNPLTNLNPSTNYTATIKGGANGVKDLAGNALAGGNTPTGDFAWAWVTGTGTDTTAPTVTGSAHINAQTNVPINTKASLTFSEAMNPLTISTANVRLQETATGAAVPLTLSYSGVTATMIPLNNLKPITNYTVTVVGDVKDLAGNPMNSTFQIGWTTAATPDTTAPTVSTTAHVNGQTNVAINTKASVAFSEAMDPLTITNLTFKLQETASSAAVAGTVSYSGVTALFTPLSNLKPSINYTVTITGGAGGVKDLAGNAMLSTFQIGWTTAAAADTTAPTVSGSIPLSRQTNVAVNTRASITYSEPMDPLTITNLNVKLQETATAIAVPGTLSYAGLTATFIPLANLKSNTNYTVTSFGGVKDLAGNPMNTTFQIGWTTGAVADTTAPTVVGTVNANGAQNVPFNSKPGATFSEAMDPLTVNGATFTLQQIVLGVPVPVPGTVSYVGVNAVFTPLSNLIAFSNYTATIKGGAGGASDLAGNPMANDYVWTWITGNAPDIVAPVITGTSFANGATNVSINSREIATFNEAVDPLTVNSVNFTMRETATGTAVAGTVSYSVAGASASFIPLSALAPTTQYTLSIKGGANGIADLAGNVMASDRVWSWTTGAIPAPPVIVLGPNPTAPDLGEAGRFVMLASQNVTGDAASSVSNGDIGILDQARAFITGFTDVGVTPNLGGFAELSSGMSYAPNDLCPAPHQCPLKFSTLPVGAAWVDAATMIVQVRTDSQAAFTFLAADPNPSAPTQVAPIELGNLVLTRGVYRNGGNIGITTGPLHLDAQGDPNSVFIIVTDGTFTTGAAGSIVLDNLAQAKNVYWLSAGNATIAANTTFHGNMFAVSRLDVLAGANVTGRLFARNDRVTLISNIVTKAP